MSKEPILFTTYDRKPGQDICNCSKCLMLGRRHADDSPGTADSYDYCPIQGGKIRSPSWSWCAAGITYMWMAANKPKDVVELLLRVEA